MSVFGVFLVRIYAHLDWIRRFTLQISVFSPSAVKCGPEKLRIRTLFTQCNPLLPDLFTRTRMVHTNKDERQNPPVPSCVFPPKLWWDFILKIPFAGGVGKFFIPMVDNVKCGVRLIFCLQEGQLRRRVSNSIANIFPKGLIFFCLYVHFLFKVVFDAYS